MRVHHLALVLALTATTATHAASPAPRTAAVKRPALNPAVRVGINPQPEPPGFSSITALRPLIVGKKLRPVGTAPAAMLKLGSSQRPMSGQAPSGTAYQNGMGVIARPMTLGDGAGLAGLYLWQVPWNVDTRNRVALGNPALPMMVRPGSAGYVQVAGGAFYGLPSGSHSYVLTFLSDAQAGSVKISTNDATFEGGAVAVNGRNHRVLFTHTASGPGSDSVCFAISIKGAGHETEIYGVQLVALD